jgi:hypothetical protein
MQDKFLADAEELRTLLSIRPFDQRIGLVFREPDGSQVSSTAPLIEAHYLAFGA